MNNSAEKPSLLVMLIIDGWGAAPETESNMIHRVKTPVFDALISKYPSTLLLLPGKELGHHYRVLGTGDSNKSITDFFAENGTKQLKIAEVEKYAYLSYFFNNCDQNVRPNEDRILIKTPFIDKYQNKPEFGSLKVNSELAKAIKSKKYGFILAAFSCLDMVLPSRDPEAIADSIRTIDKYIGKISKNVLDENGTLVICACKGGAEDIEYKDTGKKPVPFMIVDKKFEGVAFEAGETTGSDLSLLQIGGTLEDAIPTILGSISSAPWKGLKGKNLL